VVGEYEVEGVLLALPSPSYCIWWYVLVEIVRSAPVGDFLDSGVCVGAVPVCVVAVEVA